MNVKKQNTTLTTYFLVVFSMILGAGLSAAALKFLSGNHTETEQPAILYWVAPMDPNYQRQQPGKSPMGMDLVPVYANQAQTHEQEPGVIHISPAVENNLGVRTELAAFQALPSAITSVGMVKYNEHKIIHVHPRVSGWVDRLFVKATGDKVESGKAIYSLYSPQLVNAQEEYLLAISSNNQRLIESTELRLRALHIDDGFIQELRRSQKIQQSVTFYGPQDGVITQLHIREGFFVEPVSHLLSIASLDSVWVELDVLAQQLQSIQLGDRVDLHINALPDKSWQAKINYIYPTLDTTTRTARVRVNIDNREDLLKPNMYANAVIHSREQSPARLLIPKQALIRVGQKYRVVLAMGEGRFKSVEVNIGRLNQAYAEILSGIEEGDEVVTSAQFLLDSESSKQSDFLRIEGEGLQKPSANSQWVSGEILSVNQQGSAQVHHAAVPPWNWPEMTMDLKLGQQLDIKQIQLGKTVEMQLTKNSRGEVEITALRSEQNTEAPSEESQTMDKLEHKHQSGGEQ